MNNWCGSSLYHVSAFRWNREFSRNLSSVGKMTLSLTFWVVLIFMDVYKFVVKCSNNDINYNICIVLKFLNICTSTYRIIIDSHVPIIQLQQLATQSQFNFIFLLRFHPLHYFEANPRYYIISPLNSPVHIFKRNLY